MQSQLDKLDGIELKIRQLVDKLKKLKDENLSLTEKNKVLIKENENLKINIEGTIQSKAPVEAELMNHNGGLFEKQEVRAEIDSYIDEIDKCIEILKLS